MLNNLVIIEIENFLKWQKCFNLAHLWIYCPGSSVATKALYKGSKSAMAPGIPRKTNCQDALAKTYIHVPTKIVMHLHVDGH